MAILFIATVVVAVPAATGKDAKFGQARPADTERAPLLGEN